MLRLKQKTFTKQMKLQIFKAISMVALVLVFASCMDDQSKDLEKWKVQNDTYFTNMKDSADYELKQIPFEYGGGSFYYKVVKEGDINGSQPGLSDTVKVNYRGMTIESKVFDATYSGTNPINNPSAKPAQFIVGGLISGWVYTLIDMTPGEIRTIVLPSSLAYGSMGVGSIKPYSTLRFDIHLISFKVANE
jgi:FKBP-type peptidyl-prolyl cis-trans isomerase